MKKLFYILMIMSGGFAYSQVGIGTTSPQKLFHIDAIKNNASTIPTPPAKDNRNDDDVSVNNTGNVSVGNIAPNTRLDIRSSNTTNPQDAIAIGNTNQTASVAKAGALKYYPVAPVTPDFRNGNLSYSDGTVWTDLEAKVPNDFVYANNGSLQSLTNSTVGQQITNWTTMEDINSGFTQSTGVFKAVKDGGYLVTFTYSTASASISADSKIEINLNTNSTNTNTVKVYKCINSFPGNNNSSQISGQCSGIFNLNKGDNVTVSLINQSGSTKVLSSDATYTTLSIFGI